MSLDIREEALTPAALSEHAALPIAFLVDQILHVGLLDSGLGDMSLAQAAVTDPYVKDYDAIEGAGPQRWPGEVAGRATCTHCRRPGSCEEASRRTASRARRRAQSPGQVRAPS